MTGLKREQRWEAKANTAQKLSKDTARPGRRSEENPPSRGRLCPPQKRLEGREVTGDARITQAKAKCQA